MSSSKITNQYKFSVEELDLIKDNFSTHEDWDKHVFSDIKKNIRDFLRPEQDNKCCYCKKELGHDIKEVDIEHIIPKATYPTFTFEPYNFALSCPACNTIKGDKVVISKKIKKYPSHSKDIIIIHAHHDIYEENICIQEGCVFVPLNKKGSHTITICELFRLKTVIKKAKAAIANRTSESQLVNLIMGASKEELAEAMTELLKRIK